MALPTNAQTLPPDCYSVLPQQAYFAEEPRLRHQQNLPGSLARLKIAVSLRRLGERTVNIFATDVHRGSLEHAARGIYPAEAVAAVAGMTSPAR